jgi:hypothetical protein
VAVLSLESTPRGRGNRGGEPLQKGRWRRRGLGHSAQRQPVGRAVAAQHRAGGGRRRRSGPSVLQRPGGPDDQVAQFRKWKMKTELGWATRDVWAEFKLGS